MDNKEKKIIGVIGAGSWGTALAVTLADKGHTVRLYARDAALLESIRAKRENTKYLPGVKIGDNLQTAADLKGALAGADVALFSVPAQAFRRVLTDALPYLRDDMIIVNVAKGIEQGSLLRMSEVAEQVRPGLKYVALSGPSHAEEVGVGLPTTVALASWDSRVAKAAQDIFMTERFRVYTANDLVGVELGGALKNIIALGAGISDGMGFGDNAKAALMTRGLAEIRRLGVKLGADSSTFLGLAGVGDLIVTCTSAHSRNRRCGIMIGEGVRPAEAVCRVGMVVEGMTTAAAAKQLAQREGVEMPITAAINDVIDGKINAKEAVGLLMGRDRRAETDR